MIDSVVLVRMDIPEEKRRELADKYWLNETWFSMRGYTKTRDDMTNYIIEPKGSTQGLPLYEAFELTEEGELK